MASVFLRYQSGLGIAQRWATVKLEQTIRVYPNLEEAKKHTIFLLRSRQIEQEKRLQRRRGMGREFESLREWRDGDELRDICWSATARRAKLITKIHQIERSQSVWIVVDAGRLLPASASSITPSTPRSPWPTWPCFLGTRLACSPTDASRSNI